MKVIILCKFVSNLFQRIVRLWCTIDKIFYSFSVRTFSTRISINNINSIFICLFCRLGSCNLIIKISCKSVIILLSSSSLCVNITLKSILCISSSSCLILQEVFNGIIFRLSCRSFCSNGITIIFFCSLSTSNLCV